MKPPQTKAPLTIVKVGGSILDNAKVLVAFLEDFAGLDGNKILVHGGGKLATTLAEKMGIPQQIIDGRRITDKDTLDIVTMVYAGKINKSVVAELQKNGCNAVGVSGADGNTVLAHKRTQADVDFGYVGDVDSVQTLLIETLLLAGFTVVCAPITHDAHGLLLNTNADTIAQELAQAFSGQYQVTLVYSFEKPGVMMDVEDVDSVIPHIHLEYYKQLKDEKKVFAGMLPKLDNAFTAISKGVAKVIIGDAQKLKEVLAGHGGTTLEL